MAAGGEGAPLVPMLDYSLFSGLANVSRVLLNLGGIANVSALPAGGGIEKVLAFDTGLGEYGGGCADAAAVQQAV